MSILLRFAASVVPEALSKTHNGAERCRSANTHERLVYAKTERSLKVGCCGPHFNPIVVKHLRPARYDLEFPLLRLIRLESRTTRVRYTRVHYSIESDFCC